MNKTAHRTRNVVLASLLLALPWQPVCADEFTAADLARWQQEYMTVVDKGEKLFHGGLDSKNTVSCDQCHPDASNTHPETYPKFQQQLGKVAVLAEMINWCIENPLESDPLALDDPRMIALQAYITQERRQVPLAPGKH
ncbi:MAG: cytochrome C [Gammaproteobacteria bacterium]|jgi:thiosulfate dehydrogenase